MATNEIFNDPTTLSLPVPAATVSNDPVVVGSIPGVCLTDRGDGGNASTEATVAIRGVFELPVDGEIAAVGDPVYFDGSDLNPDTGELFGFALATVASAQTANIPVLLAGPQADAVAS